MALLGMQVVLLRAMKSSAGFDGTILNALACMALLGAVGAIIGAIAQQTVDDSVRNTIEAELTTAFGESPEETLIAETLVTEN